MNRVQIQDCFEETFQSALQNIVVFTFHKTEIQEYFCFTVHPFLGSLIKTLTFSRGDFFFFFLNAAQEREGNNSLNFS